MDTQKEPGILAPNVLKKISKIGEGAYGAVYDATYIHDDKIKVAVKRNFVDNTTTFLGSIRELDILTKLKGHPFIVDLAYVSLDNPFSALTPLSPHKGNNKTREDKMYFIFEAGAYDCHTLIHGNKSAYCYLKMAMVQVLLGVEYMHAKGIYHRDLKPSNLIWYRYGNERSLKIADFGMSKVNTEQEPKSPRVTTSYYRSIEVALMNTDYTEKSDMWSMGTIFFEMVARKALLKDVEQQDPKIVSAILERCPRKPTPNLINKLNKINMKYRQGAFKMERNLKDSLGLTSAQIQEFNAGKNTATYDQFLNLVTGLLELDPNERLSATQALNHEFFEIYKPYINQVREKFPPVSDPVPKLLLSNSTERQKAINIAFTIFNNRQTLYWYSHRILFQGIDLFDRYLNSLKTKLTDYHIELYFMCCVYISIKYFSTVRSPCPFRKLVVSSYQTPEAIRLAEDFEKILITSTLRFKVYRDTLFEISDKFNVKLSENQIKNLLIFYGGINKCENKSLTDLFKEFADKEGISLNNKNSNEKKVQSISLQSIPSTMPSITLQPQNNQNQNLTTIKNNTIFVSTNVRPENDSKALGTTVVPTRMINTVRQDINSFIPTKVSLENFRFDGFGINDKVCQNNNLSITMAPSMNSGNSTTTTTSNSSSGNNSEERVIEEVVTNSGLIIKIVERIK